MLRLRNQGGPGGAGLHRRTGMHGSCFSLTMPQLSQQQSGKGGGRGTRRHGLSVLRFEVLYCGLVKACVKTDGRHPPHLAHAPSSHLAGAELDHAAGHLVTLLALRNDPSKGGRRHAAKPLLACQMCCFCLSAVGAGARCQVYCSCGWLCQCQGNPQHDHGSAPVQGLLLTPALAPSSPGSEWASSISVYNELLATRPDLVSSTPACRCPVGTLPLSAGWQQQGMGILIPLAPGMRAGGRAGRAGMRRRAGRQGAGSLSLFVIFCLKLGARCRRSKACSCRLLILLPSTV